MSAEHVQHGHRSHSHLRIPDHILDNSLEIGVGTKKSHSHVRIPDEIKNAKHEAGSLSHLSLPKKGKSLSHVAAIDNKMAFIHNLPVDRVANDHAPPAATVVTVESVVYVTASTPDGKPSPTQSSNGNGNGNNSGDPRSSYASAKSAAQRSRTFNQSPSQTPTAAATSRSIAQTPAETSRAASTPATLATSAVIGGGLTSSIAASSPATNNFASSTAGIVAPTIVNNAASNSSGLSGGGKAGLAIGVLIAVAIAAGLVLFCLRRRKNAIKEDSEVNNEKHGSFFGSNQQAPPEFNGTANNDSTRGASTAPRLSLRPVTQLLSLPNMMAASKSDASMSEKPQSSWERKQINPFDDNTVLSEKQARPESPPTNPFDEGDGRKSPSQKSITSSNGGSQPSGDAAMAAGALGPRGPNNVHRVQLDFKPTMDDELELKSGQLVRMLHEYDDGWALCIRMDRSQQGVCPRTCLSKLAVKPRPQGPPPNGPNGRGSPNGPNGRMSPNERPMPPPNGSPRGSGNSNMMPRPLSPNTQQRERAATVTKPSPPPQAASPRVRSQSVAESTGVPVRKPVPGQAL